MITRRDWTIGLAGLGAATAGALWQSRRRSADELGDLWAMRFARPEGGELVLSTLRGQPLLLNFWATWCPPCVKEMPLLDRFQSTFTRHHGQVVGLAVDGPTPVREFLKRVPVRFPIGLAGFDGTDLSKRLGNAQGSLPFTVLIGAEGRILQRKLGENSASELARWVTDL